MAKSKPINRLLCEDYMRKFPNTPNLTLAKKIYKEHPIAFTNVDHCRSIIRMINGNLGKRNREQVVDKSLFTSAKPLNPFNLPDSHADSYKPFILRQSKTLILSDLHFPYQDNKAIELALNYGLEKKVDCILINGDLIDFATISRHEKDWRHRSVKVEFDSVRQFLQGLRKAFPKARIIYKYGNHDERWEKWLYVKAPEIFDVNEFQLEVLLRLAELKIEVIKDKIPIQIGKLNVLHGHEVFGTGGVNPARATFTKTLDDTLVGHYHRTSSHAEPTMNNKLISTFSQGCLCDMHPMFARINKWNLGFSYVELNMKTDEYHLTNLKIVNYKVY